MTNPPTRRPSFGMLLRRSKSGDLGKSKKAQALREADLARQRQPAPKLPEFRSNVDRLGRSIGSDYLAYGISSGPDPVSSRPTMDPPRYVAADRPPVPPIPFDPYARTESMTHRGRYSYVSSAISTICGPRRFRRRRDPTPFNILIVGTRSAGKTSFLEFLKTALALPTHKRPKATQIDDFRLPAPASGNFSPHYLETELDGERVGVTLWDSEGLEKNLVDLQLRELSSFLESKFDDTLNEEMKVVRSPGVRDTHIHAVFLVLDPARLDRNIAAARTPPNGYRNGAGHEQGPPVFGGLDQDLDLQVLRTLSGKTTVIPVISKADTVTTKHMNVLKKAVWESMRKANLDPLEALGLDEDSGSTPDRIDEEDEDGASESGDEPSSPPMPPGQMRPSSQSMRRHKALEEAKGDDMPPLPLSIISPDLYEPGIPGRRFPWGFADPYHQLHCDFQRLKETIFSDWRAELREASRVQWYEGWRTNKLKQGGPI